MRVGLIGPLPPELGGATPGGVATHQMHLAAGLAMRGDVHVALLATNVSGCVAAVPYEAHTVGESPSALVPAARYALALARAGRGAGSRRETLRQLLGYRRFLHATRPDVVHVQHPLERAAYVRQVAALEGRSWPLVVTAHSFFGEHSDEVIWGFMAPNLRAADRVIAVSPHIAEQAVQLGVERERIRVIRSGVDTERFRPRNRTLARSTLGIDPSTPLVLFVGNLEPRKQLDVLLRALACLPDALLVVVGTGDSAGADDQTHRLHALAGELGLTTRVRFVGRVDEATLSHWYAAADAFTLPSSSEAQGIVALEAMASGLPVVASAVGGLLGTIEDGQDGYLVPPGAVEPLATRLSLLLDSPAQRAEIGAAARERVCRDFSWPAAVQATVEVYRELAERPHALVVPLGETSRADVLGVVEPHFVAAAWLDRSALRRELPRAWRRNYPNAVLVAPDLAQPRLILTSFLLGLVRAETYWRLDLRGRLEPFGLGAHLRQSVWPIARHVLAGALAFVFAYPVLLALRALLAPRHIGLRRPRSILYLRSQFWLGLQGGGSVAHTAGVIDGLEQAGVRVDVVSSDHLVGVHAPTTVVAPTTWFDGTLRELEELAYNVAFFRAARCARRPDAIYQRHTGFNVTGAVLSRLWRVPLVLEFNSSEVWKGQHWGGLRLLGIASLVEEINLRAADRVVVVSQALADQLPAYADKMLVNPNGVDPARFDPTPKPSGGEVVLCFSGTFGVWHGIPTLAAVLPRVLAARPAVRVVLLGDGPLRHLVEGLDNERITLTGLVPHGEVPRYLAQADILLSPHGAQVDGGEFFGSPTKLFEYMAAGRAIVASAVGQIAHVLEGERTALLVPPDDPDELCSAIVRLIDDPVLRTRLGAAARTAAVSNHTWRQNAEYVLTALEAQ